MPIQDPMPVSDFFYIVKSAAKKVSSKGDTYLDLVFMDAKGEISSKLWDYKEEAHSWIQPNMIVKVRGAEEIWNEKKQFRLQRIRRVCPEDRFRLSDLVPCAPYEGEDLFETILQITDSFSDEGLKGLVQDILTRYKEKIIVCPAAVKLHHAVCSGLLYHTLSVVRLAQAACGVYPFLDSDLLLSGAILHDISKIDELKVEETGIASGYTPRGQLLGHLVMGAMEIEAAGTRLGVDPERLLLLEHMLISHHGVPEFGSDVRPMCLEAQVLAALDDLDAKVNQISCAVSQVEKGGFSEKMWALDQRRFYNFNGLEVPKADILNQKEETI